MSQDKLMPTEEMIEAGICKAGEIQNAATSAEFATAIYIAMEAARPTTDVSTDVLERLRALVAFMDLNRIAMLGAGEGHRIIANDLRSLIEGREALQRSNAEKDEALRQIATVSAKTEYAHQLRDIARKALSHSSEQTHD